MTWYYVQYKLQCVTYAGVKLEEWHRHGKYFMHVVIRYTIIWAGLHLEYIVVQNSDRVQNSFCEKTYENLIWIRWGPLYAYACIAVVKVRWRIEMFSFLSWIEMCKALTYVLTICVVWCINIIILYKKKNLSSTSYIWV